jgi:putative membrane protein
MSPDGLQTSDFWRHAFAIRGTASPHVLPRVLVFGGLAALVTALIKAHPRLAIAVGPIEVSGAVIALILILRTNSGYERWWEGRKLWGGIVNQSRNVVISGLAYGPPDRSWRERLARWTAAFPHAARRSLRGERDAPELASLLGEEAAASVTSSQHVPAFVAAKIASVLREGRDDHDGLDGYAFLQVDRERALLVDHIGGCERILKTPLAFAYAVKIRRFIVLYLLLLPFGLVATSGG